MPLTLVLGPANSAKAGAVLGAFAAAAPRGALLVVPTAADAEHYSRELAGDGCLLGSVLTFAGLGAEIGRRAGCSPSKLSELQRERVLARSLGAFDPGALGAPSSAPGLIAAAAELVAELERDLITPQRFTTALRAWAAADERRVAYANDLARLYGRYRHELDRLGRADRELAVWQALDMLRAAPGAWGAEPVFFYGFDDLTGLELDAVETLARVVGVEVTVSLTYEPGRAALAARAETVEALRPLARSVVELPAQDEHYARPARAVLHHIERSLFEPRPRRVDPGAAVALLEAGGERAEAELVGERVVALLHAGVEAQEIAIVYRDPLRAAPLLARVLGSYGAALAARRRLPLSHTALGRAVLGAARCAWLEPAQASADDLLAYLRAPGLLEQPEVADRLEAEVRRRGLRTAAQAAGTHTCRRALSRELGELDALAAAPDPAGALCRLAGSMLAAARRPAGGPLDRLEEADARALAALCRASGELAELVASGDQRPHRAELVELLAGIPVEHDARPGPGAVLLAGPLEIRARRFRAVFICGLQEGEFPAPGRPEPFLSDERRRELAIASGLRLRRREDALAAERYLFYSAMSRATEHVYLSYRSSDEEGNLALASPFIADVAELLDEGWLERRERRPLADVVWAPSRAPTERERKRALAAQRAPAAGEPEPAPRSLGADALASLRHSRILSAGALESYGDCPVRWLVERELAPALLAPERDPVLRGNVMHLVLERLLRRLGGPVTAASLPEAERLLDEVMSELPTADGPVAELAAGSAEIVRAGALREIEADLRRYLRHEAVSGSGWRPAGLELRFGFEQDEGSLPPLALAEGDEQVLVRGVIDRLEVDGAGHAIVRDYKSGAAGIGWAAARWAAERQLQVALYMLVARQLAGLEPVGGFYQPLRGEDLRARGVFVRGAPVGDGVLANDGREPAELDDLLADAAARALVLARRLRSGELTPCPQNCSRDGCAHPGICRSQ
jgi:ATP-dependent helicase/DNAse subunit B